MPVATPQLVVIDTETTGLDPARDRIIDMGAVRLGPDLEIVDRFTTLVAPGRLLPLAIERLTGITDSDLSDAPPFAAAFADLTTFAGEALIVGQNVAFDLDMLAAGARRARLAALPNRSFDTLAASLLLFPELDRHNLRAMAEHLEIESRPHRALPDAEVTAALLAALSRRAAALPAAERRLLAAAGWDPLLTLDGLSSPKVRRAGPAVDAPTFHERVSAPAAGGAPAALDCEPQAWQAAFAPGGALSQGLTGFAERPGQVELAQDIAAVFESGGIAVLEAGTGMGKSLAYLLPAAFHGASGGRRVMVSTRTKALQRQLAERELPLVASCLPAGWRWALLMGRENYLCRRRLDEAVSESARGLPDRERLLALAYLCGRTRLGEVDLSALPFRAVKEMPALRELGRELRSATATCLGRRCSSSSRCPWRLARARADTAHLVCVNHALLLTGGATLPAFEELIIDEAHLLPDEAISAHTDRIDRWSLAELLTDARGRRGQKALSAVAASAAAKTSADVAAALDSAASAFEQTAREIPGLIDDVGATLEALSSSALGVEEGSGPNAGRGDGYARSTLLTAGLQEQPAFDDFATAGAALGASLAALAQAAAVTAEALPEEQRERPRAVTLAADAAAAATLLDELTGRLSPEIVGWVELEGTPAPGAGRRARPAGAGLSPAPPWSLNRAPLSPAPLIRERLWERLRGAVLTSATLSVAGSFAYFREQAGLAGDLDVHERIFASPFDYRRQASLVLEHDPETPYAAADLPARQAERLRRLTELTGGRLLALFTNKRHLEQVADQIGSHVEEDGVVVLAQGRHGSAAALAEEFRNQPATVLLGVDALWTGQDFPGEALVCLVIAKLPFPRQDALFQARRRAAEEAGTDWFRSFYLPEAILKFRQGFGRLIRTETDYGVVAVLDHRLTQKGYQRDFLASLPPMEVLRAAPEELPDVVAQQLRLLRAAAEDHRRDDV